MDGHAAACRNAGPRVCQLVASRRDGDPPDTLQGSLSLRAEPQWLQRFMKGVQNDAIGAAGRVTSQWTTTEDLTRDIVDTEATLRAKRALRDRLQQLLATRPGSLSDLLGVERELSRVQGRDRFDRIQPHRHAHTCRDVGPDDRVRVERARDRGRHVRAVAAARSRDFIVAVVESTATLVTVVGALLPWVVVASAGRVAPDPPPARRAARRPRRGRRRSRAP